MVKINLPIDKLVDEITLNLTRIEAVEAIVVYGSVATKTHDEYSDIDLIAYIGDQQDFEKAVKTVRYEITKPIWELEKNIIMEYEIDDKLVKKLGTSGKRKPPASKDTGDDVEQTSYLDLPYIVEVRESGWDSRAL